MVLNARNVLMLNVFCFMLPCTTVGGEKGLYHGIVML